MDGRVSDGPASLTSYGVSKPEEWSDCSLAEYFRQDQRPIFVVDLKSPNRKIVFRNAALTVDYDYEEVVWSDLQERFALFAAWARSPNVGGESIVFKGVTWSATILRKRWKVVTGCQPPKPGKAKRPALNVNGRSLSQQQELAFAEHLLVKEARSRSHDWTSVEEPVRTTPHIAFMRQWDWASTPLGPLESWSSPLKTMANLILTDPQPAVMFWGPKMVSLYNEPYKAILNLKHPRAMGEPYLRTWSELYKDPETAQFLDDIWTRGREHGEATQLEQTTFFLSDGTGDMYERVFNITLYPIVGESGEVVAFYEPCREVTAEVINGRRTTVLRRIGELAAGEERVENFFQSVQNAFAENLNDIPFALLYSINHSDGQKWPDLAEGTFADIIASGRLRLTGDVGLAHEDVSLLPIAHSLLCESKDIQDGFQRLRETAQPVVVDIQHDEILVAALRDDTGSEEEPARGYGDDPRRIAMLPIRPAGLSEGLFGVLMIGLNPRLKYDDDYSIWLKTLSRSISSSLAAVLLITKQQRIVKEARGEAADAKLDQERISAAIEISSVGVFIMTPEGEMEYVNKAWREITAYGDGPFVGQSWITVVHPDDLLQMHKIWSDALEFEITSTEEIRLSAPWHSKDPDTGEEIVGETWVKSGVHVKTFGGKKLVMGSITDISSAKWAEKEQTKMKDEAIERKRQQENFIDMTSHEMRNPLSAVFQCADAIASALTTIQSQQPRLSQDSNTKIGRLANQPPPEDPITSCIELAKTITLCAQHQKRIVDDVLVLSKVDANLIEICPIEVQPRVLVDNVQKMFTAELNAIDAEMDIKIEPSIDELNIDWLMIDSGRLFQILINLCTNAIKFTTEASERRITISLGASKELPNTSTCWVNYLSDPHESKLHDPTSNPESGDGEAIYLHLSVKDTGKGMNDDEMKVLFQRFQQASPRTHTQYGGSGLGLYIARLLSRLQGGEIGVTSSPGKGSTFAFFIRARRCEAPASAMKDGTIPDVALTEDGEVKPPISPHDLSILIVEDNLVNQRVLAKQLRNIGFTVYTANHGQEAVDFLHMSSRWCDSPLDEAEQLDVDLILMDVEMPIMNGIDATRQIRAYERDGKMKDHVPIIAITGNARREQVEETIEAGMDGVMSKPFRVPELLQKLAVFVGPIESPGQDGAAR